MRPWEHKIVPVGFLAAGALFIFAAARPAFTGGSLDVTLFVVGIACLLVALATRRSSPGSTPPGS